MMPSAEVAEPKPEWLSQTILRVLKLPRELPPRPGIEGLTLQLLKSIEADELPVPTVCVTRKGSIRLVWEHHHRTLIVCVTGHDSFRVGRIDGGIRMPIRTIHRNRVEEMRHLIGWLYPLVNTSSVAAYRKKGDR